MHNKLNARAHTVEDRMLKTSKMGRGCSRIFLKRNDDGLFPVKNRRNIAQCLDELGAKD